MQGVQTPTTQASELRGMNLDRIQYEGSAHLWPPCNMPTCIVHMLHVMVPPPPPPGGLTPPQPPHRHPHVCRECRAHPPPPLPPRTSICIYITSCSNPPPPLPSHATPPSFPGGSVTSIAALQVVTAASLINTNSSSSQTSNSSRLEAAVAAATLPLAAPLNFTNLQMSALHAVPVSSF